MLRKGIVIAALCLLPAVVKAQSARGPFELELGGAASNGPNFNGCDIAVDGSLGYFFSDTFEVSLKQNAAYSDIGGVGFNGSTRVAVDANIPLGDQGQVMPFVGVNVGYAYGNNGFHDTWEGAPEAGVKLFVDATTFIYVSAEYQFFFDQHTSTIGSAFHNGEFLYGLGLGFRF